MENFENNESRLNRLFALAKQDEPVMHLDEARQIVSTGRFIKSNGGHWLNGKYFILMGLAFVGALSFILITNMPESKGGKMHNNTSGVQLNAAEVVPPATTEAVVSTEPENTSNAKVIHVNTNETIKENVVNETSKVASTSKKALSNAQKVTWYYDGNARVQFKFEGSNVEIVANEKLIHLLIDGEKIPESEYNIYSEIIKEGMKLKDAEETRRKSANNKLTSEELQKKTDDSKIMKAMIETLKSDGLITEDDSFDFRLTGNDVMLNDKSLGAEAFNKYKSVYETTAGKTLPAKANIRIKH